ncbi:MAG: ABC transporter ATP-binding protein, partial [Erysipelotrichaceae bacterium]|nr:ABC transporter ATP-binding protein [Erysipelotrichaceae bacterium]
ITSVVTVIGIAFMMFSINVVITLVVLVILPISVLIMAKIMGRSQKYFKNQQEYLGHVNGRIEEMFSGYDVVKAFNAEDKILNDFEIENKKLGDTGWKSQFISGLMHPLMTFIGNINYVVVAILGSYFTIKGKMSVGDIQSFISYSKNFTQPLAQIAQVSNMLQSMIAAAERVFEFLDSEEEEVSKNIVKLDNISGNVSFNHVKFGYNENQTVIKDFSVNVKSGQKVAIVGPTGAGKTTLIKLLMRFYRVNDGSILIDNKNINDLETDDLRKAFGMVLQDTWLFSGTIADNLRYGKLDATEDEITSASKAAYADHFIKTLPDGYNMILNEETDNISQGQKQLLTIARAILADPKVLILDEATSSVDTRTEILIQKAMDELMKGRTSFIIAHRLSTIKNADLILVMDEGDIVETGTHKELLDKNGFYASLYNSQFEKINN